MKIDFVKKHSTTIERLYFFCGFPVTYVVVGHSLIMYFVDKHIKVNCLNEAVILSVEHKEMVT